jgi:hypothetical protein
MNKIFIKQYWFELLVIIIALITVLFTSMTLSPTWDEAKHTVNGLYYLKEKNCCIHEETPFAGFHAVFLNKYLPESIDQYTPPEKIYDSQNGKTILLLSRLFNIFFYILLLIVVWLWSKDILSKKIAKCCLLLAAFSPSLLAHAGIATEEMFLTTWALISFYLFYRFTKKPNYKNIIFLSIVIGICLLTKISALILYACIMLSFLIFVIHRLSKHDKILKYVIFLIVIIVLPLFLLNLGYFFNGTFNSLDSIEFKSESLNSYKNSFIRKIPLPLPEGYLKSIDFNRRDSSEDSRSYLFGKFQRHNNPWYYFSLTFLFKTSIIMLFFIFFGIYKFKNKNKNVFLTLSLFIFPLIFLLVNSFFNPYNIGVRYILPIYPFLIIISGYSFLSHKKMILKILLVIFIIISLFNFPNYLGFFNVSSQFIPKEFLLGDSNLDWGQMNYLIKKDMEEKNISKGCWIIPSPDAFAYLYHINGLQYSPYADKCTLYVSKVMRTITLDEIPFISSKKIDYVLGGIIEVYDFSNDSNI